MVRLQVTNNGDKPFEFTASLHRWVCNGGSAPADGVGPDGGEGGGWPARRLQPAAAKLCGSAFAFLLNLLPHALRRAVCPCPPSACSYFGVDDVETANVRGLEGLEYLDRVSAGGKNSPTPCADRAHICPRSRQRHCWHAPASASNRPGQHAGATDGCLLSDGPRSWRSTGGRQQAPQRAQGAARAGDLPRSCRQRVQERPRQGGSGQRTGCVPAVLSSLAGSSLRMYTVL